MSLRTCLKVFKMVVISILAEILGMDQNADNKEPQSPAFISRQTITEKLNGSLSGIGHKKKAKQMDRACIGYFFTHNTGKQQGLTIK